MKLNWWNEKYRRGRFIFFINYMLCVSQQPLGWSTWAVRCTSVRHSTSGQWIIEFLNLKCETFLWTMGARSNLLKKLLKDGTDFREGHKKNFPARAGIGLSRWIHFCDPEKWQKIPLTIKPRTWFFNLFLSMWHDEQFDFQFPMQNLIFFLVGWGWRKKKFCEKVSTLDFKIHLQTFTLCSLWSPVIFCVWWNF